MAPQNTSSIFVSFKVLEGLDLLSRLRSVERWSRMGLWLLAKSPIVGLMQGILICHQIGKNSVAAKCNACHRVSTLATRLDCKISFCVRNWVVRLTNPDWSGLVCFVCVDSSIYTRCFVIQVKVDRRVFISDPRDVICDVVEKMGVDMVVLGSHGTVTRLSFTLVKDITRTLDEAIVLFVNRLAQWDARNISSIQNT
uniref:Putative rossmann-like alpha/beta/alpha sandwich fold protein n=1 Tax=Helianthus annuus TaxID=4232 RepID=A0A251UHR3_HELAN